jgi:DNA recombination protein RmuC
VDAYNAALGSLQARVLPQLRRMEGAGARSEKQLSEPAPLDSSPRLVSAPELLAASGSGAETTLPLEPPAEAA